MYRNKNNNGSGSGNSFNANAKEYTKEERQRLSAVLNKQLGPEYISKRPSGGGPVSYIEGWKALNLANHVFGFDGWTSEIKSTTVDYVDDHGGNGRFSVGLSVIIRITLKDGTFHEDLGYGSIENCKGRALAFEKCKKQAITDGMKRCLRCFGSVLGNCLYDKEFLKYIWKVKVQPKKIREEDLLRHPDIEKANALKNQELENTKVGAKPLKTPNPPTAAASASTSTSASAAAAAKTSLIKKETKIEEKSILITGKEEIFSDSIFDDSLDENFDEEIDNEFNDIDEYDLELMETSCGKEKPKAQSIKKETENKEHTPELATSAVVSSSKDNNNNGSTLQEIPVSVGFFSAKVAEQVQQNPPANLAKYDPKVHSQSLKRTLDQTRSTPVKRSNIQQNPVYPRLSQGSQKKE